MSEFRVLILEDDAVLALDLATIVTCWADIRITLCRSLKQARKALVEDFDFALLDIELGDGKSYDLASELRDRRLPFAFVTGSVRADLPAGLRDAAFIAKPYDQRTIEKLLAHAGAKRQRKRATAEAVAAA